MLRAGRGQRPGPWPLMGLLLVCAIHLFSFYRPPMPPIHGDGYYTYLWARSLAYDFDLRLENDYRLCGDPWRMLTPEEPGLGPRNTWSPGPALVWTPMLWVGRVILPAAAASSDAKVAGACQGELAEFAMLGTVLMGLVTIFLAYGMARRYVGAGPAALAAAGVALASPLPYYSTLLPSYTHGAAAFGVALVIAFWDRTRGGRHPLRWSFMGLLLGIAMLMRAQTALIALAPLLEWLWLLRTDVRERNVKAIAVLVLSGLLFVTFAIVAFFPQMYAWKISYGSYLAVPQGPHYMRWGHASIDGVLFASTGGLLTWTPLLYTAFFGLVAGLFVRRTRPLCIALGLVIVAFTYVNAAVWDYWGSVGFSNRRFTALSLPFAVGMAIFAELLFRYAQRRPRRFAALALTAGLSVFAVWNYGAMWAVAKARLPTWREAPMTKNWSGVFDELITNGYEQVGNPLAWPASLPFAVAYDTEPRRYDVMRGMGIYYQEFRDRRPRPNEDIVRFAEPARLDYVVEGFAQQPKVIDRHHAIVTNMPRARTLLPFFADDVAAIELTWAAADRANSSRLGSRNTTVWLVWNGTPLAQLDVEPRFQTTVIAMPRGTVEVGINEVEWFTADGALAIESLRVIATEPRPH